MFKSKAFTIIEVIAAIFVITIGVLAAFTVVQQIVFQTITVSSRLTAAYLAKEGIEIVRNIKDTNWLDPADPPWNNGLGAGDWEADYNDSSLTVCPGSCDFSNLRFLKINGGFYNYSSGTDSKFKRKITITPEGADKLKVYVEILWQEKGQDRNITVQENLYDWY